MMLVKYQKWIVLKFQRSLKLRNIPCNAHCFKRNWKTKKNLSIFNTFLSGFPAGTVSGAPKIRAMEIIDELESSKRKLYAGGIGYFTSKQDFDTCIALRTALIKDKKIYVQSGAGIVADSNPNNEYNETVNKAKALLKAIS